MKVRINAHGNALPEAHGEWIDLCTAEDTTLSFLEYKIISLGISIEIPAGYYAHIVPRSSTFGKWGILLANSMGVIENDYCGDGDVWGFPAVCLRKDGTTIPKGTRICQFRLVEKAPPVEFVQVESLGNENRGGYGSTGERAGMTESRQPQEMPGQRMSRVERMFGSRDSWATPAADIAWSPMWKIAGYGWEPDRQSSEQPSCRTWWEKNRCARFWICRKRHGRKFILTSAGRAQLKASSG